MPVSVCLPFSSQNTFYMKENTFYKKHLSERLSAFLKSEHTSRPHLPELSRFFIRVFSGVLCTGISVYTKEC